MKKSKFHDAGGPDTVVSPIIMQRQPSRRKKCGIRILGSLKPKDKGKWSCIITNQNGKRSRSVHFIR